MVQVPFGVWEVLVNYPFVTTENIEEITVFNDVDFEFPDYQHLKSYLEENYPYQKEFSQEQILNCVSRIVHQIGCSVYLVGVEENVVCKLINRSLLLSEKLDSIGTAEEFAFLES